MKSRELTEIRKATHRDAELLEALIPLSARSLLKALYSDEQIEAALGPVFGLDRQLIEDGSYYVAIRGNEIVGCGGWSMRSSKFGGDAHRDEPERLLDPAKEPARIRAFFVHPDHIRTGIGEMILQACEDAIAEEGFQNIEIVATLAGELLYRKHDYDVRKRYEISLSGGLGIPAVVLTKALPWRAL